MLADIPDINTSDWTEKDGAKERTLKYVMHMVSPSTFYLFVEGDADR